MTAPTSFDQMVADMLRCEQTPGQTVYQHGQSVTKVFFRLKDHLKGDAVIDEPGWRLPSWFGEYGEAISDRLYDDTTTSLYTLYHDCGKPYCRIVGEDGKVRFPGHADVSAETWAAVGGDERVGRLIRDDMLLHTASADEIANFCTGRWSPQEAATLLVAALAEIHSNARMFGGIESVSFKQKYKNLDRRGKQICKHFFPGGGDESQRLAPAAA